MQLPPQPPQPPNITPPWPTQPPQSSSSAFAAAGAVPAHLTLVASAAAPPPPPLSQPLLPSTLQPSSFGPPGQSQTPYQYDVEFRDGFQEFGEVLDEDALLGYPSEMRIVGGDPGIRPFAAGTKFEASQDGGKTWELAFTIKSFDIRAATDEVPNYMHSKGIASEHAAVVLPSGARSGEVQPRPERSSTTAPDHSSIRVADALLRAARRFRHQRLNTQNRWSRLVVLHTCTLHVRTWMLGGSRIKGATVLDSVLKPPRHSTTKFETH